jgi:hypothetical protein
MAVADCPMELIDLSEDLFQIDMGSIGRVARRVVKWNVGRLLFAISFPFLTKLDVALVVEHCLQVHQMIDVRVGVLSGSRFVSYAKVLPQTFSDALRVIWDVNEAGHPYPTPDEDGFCEMLQHFFAEFADPEDCYDLAQLLQTSGKPSTMTVTDYFCRLYMLNAYLTWLHGATPSLTPAKLRQAFHDGMPEQWRLMYLMAGRFVDTDTTAEIKQFFRKCQFIDAKTVTGKRKSPDDSAGTLIAFVSLNTTHHFDSFTLPQGCSE